MDSRYLDVLPNCSSPSEFEETNFRMCLACGTLLRRKQIKGFLEFGAHFFA